MLKTYIGESALLEQTAEECVELAHACLKLARYIRNENQTHKKKEDIIANLHEECADVLICLSELAEDGVVNAQAIHDQEVLKQQRMKDRIDKFIKENNLC